MKLEEDDPVMKSDFINQLPLRLINTETIPSASASFRSVIDWLPDFAGYAWIAYGASSCLVISHLPSHLSTSEPYIGPIFRQVFEFSVAISAVTWRPGTPSSGDLACASDNFVYLITHDSRSSCGSFSWSQSTVLVHSTSVEAITWSESADGIISCGVEVVIWKNNGHTWEIAWNMKTEAPQNLVSASWSIEGPSATAFCLNKMKIEEPIEQIREASKHVLLFHSYGRSNYFKSDLCHPGPITWIKWRPLTASAKCSQRNILLTCCLDGALRLWGEIYSEGVINGVKDCNRHTTVPPSFHVIAVIEVNQELGGSLRDNIFITWATEINCVCSISNSEVEANQMTPPQEFYTEQSGKCGWLVGFGPGFLLSFWAVHCVDDISPPRFPRVMLWKSQNLQGHGTVPHITGNFQSNGHHIILDKVIIYRNHSFGSPSLCSLVQLLPSNSLEWSVLRSKASSVGTASWKRDDELSIHSSETRSLYGHSYSLVQVLVHPCGLEAEAAAASLDSNGIILFWSISKNYSHNLGLPVLNPTWKLCGYLTCQDTVPKYTSIRWMPSVLNGIFVLFVGHDAGIDCFAVKISQTNVVFHKLCDLPFYRKICGGNCHFDILTITVPRTHENTCSRVEVLLLSSWRNSFEVLSWNVIIYSLNISESSKICCFDSSDFVISEKLSRFEQTFLGKRYVVAVLPCPLQFPESHTVSKVSSFCTITDVPHDLIPSGKQKTLSSDNQLCGFHPYHLITGYSDGSLKLWRCDFGQLLSSPFSCLELVGVLAAHDSPISTMSITSCGRKVATISKADPATAVCILSIWDSLHVYGSGTFVLEDTIHLDSDVVALNWLTLGNGRFLLGVCMHQEFRIYMARRFSCSDLNNENPTKMNIWVCTAVYYAPLAISDFVWGPKSTIIIIHEYYFSIIGPFLLFMPRKFQSEHVVGHTKGCIGGGNVETDVAFHPLKVFHVEGSECKLRTSVNHKMCITDLGERFLSSNIPPVGDQVNDFEVLSILEAEKMLCGPLPAHHPDALLLNIYSGNWMQAQIAIQHLYEFVKNVSTSKRYEDGNLNCVISQLHLSNDSEKNLHGGINKEDFYRGSCTNFHGPGENDAFSSSKSETSNWSTSLHLPKLHDFIEPIEKLYKLAHITNEELLKLLAIIDLLIEINGLNSSAYKSLDDPGRRFWAAIRFQQLYFQRRVGRSPLLEEFTIDSKLFGWAFHSDFQETILNCFLPNEYSWEDLRTLGVGFWFVDQSLLRKMLEKLARSQYLEKRDPKACALLYVVLNRLQVLAGLFKVGKDEKDNLMAGFLSRNFEHDKNKEAALKNAYVLMGRHQLDLAVAFFFLGGDITSAVTVCARNLGDEQLALVICRLFEGNGGTVGQNLISKVLLPSAIHRGDYWMESILQWTIGDYSRAFSCMLGIQIDHSVDLSSFSSRHYSLRDPNVGQYCVTLASKNNFRSVVGCLNASVLRKWANLAAAYSFNICGIPLESLRHISWYPRRIAGVSGEEEKISNINNSEILNSLLKPNPGAAFNWIHVDVSSCLEVQLKMHLALQYLYPLMLEHPYWTDIDMVRGDISHINENETVQVSQIIEGFWAKLESSLVYFEQKYSLVPAELVNLISTSLCNNGFFLFGYSLSQRYASQIRAQDIVDTTDSLIEYPTPLKTLLIRATDDLSCGISRFIVACNMSFFPLISCPDDDQLPEKGKTWLCFLKFCFREYFFQIRVLKHFLIMFCGRFDQGLVGRLLVCFDILAYHSLFSFSWLQRSFGVLLSMLHTLNVRCCEEREPCEFDATSMEKLSLHITELFSSNSVGVHVRPSLVAPPSLCGNGGFMQDDEKFKVIGACLSRRMLHILKSQIGFLSKEMVQCGISQVSTGIFTECNSLRFELEQMMETLTNFLLTTFEHLSQYHSKQLVSFLWHKMEGGLPVETFKWLAGSESGQCFSKNNTDMSDSNLLWNICVDPALVSGILGQKNMNLLQFASPRHYKKWVEVVEDSRKSCFMHETEGNQEQKVEGNSSDNNHVFAVKGVFENRYSGEKSTSYTQLSASFEGPKEVNRRNGEHFEALCVNSVDHCQSAVAGNQKGIFFYNWEEGLSFCNSSENIWAEVEWPNNGWAGVETTSGVGFVSKKSTHFGLRGGFTDAAAAVENHGVGFPASGSYGTPVSASVDASGFGLENHEDLDDFVCPPPTSENIIAKAFSSHPYKPFFLVGSTNSCIYLWEFGRDRAAATHVFSPPANVPSDCAMASVSAVQFDHFGHRFATAASDGTVCTWQVEAGAQRHNIGPTDSTVCFDTHAWDVTYRGSSGSIIAAAGCSSNGTNVVIWDTLAPPSSRTSIVCHEGGANSIAAFDGEGRHSTPPLIVTGGRDGCIGIHDLRYMPTISGMLLHVPNAHSGGVTKVSTVPNTGMFLTGGMDGDVKLWDAKTAKPVFHWPKLHERPTFLQPAGSWGSGGRAAVTGIVVVPYGFVTCGGDGCVKLVRLCAIP